MKTKPILLSICLLAITTFSFSQKKDSDSKQEPEPQHMRTLFDDRPLTFGGFGGPRVAYSEFYGKEAWLVGGRGGVIINHSFVLGGAGYGIVNSPKVSDITYNDQHYPVAYLEGGYGGVYFEYIFMPYRIVHFSIPLIIGAGGLVYAETPAVNTTHDYNERIIATSAFFVIEPGIELELNVFRFMRIAAGASYRYSPNIYMPSTPSNAFNSPVYSLSFKFGYF